jgi:hypothetical protein
LNANGGTGLSEMLARHFDDECYRLSVDYFLGLGDATEARTGDPW